MAEIAALCEKKLSMVGTPTSEDPGALIHVPTRGFQTPNVFGGMYLSNEKRAPGC